MIPLVFGFNLWFSAAWDVMWQYTPVGSPAANYDADLFGGRDEPRRAIRDGVALVDGIRPMGALRLLRGHRGTHAARRRVPRGARPAPPPGDRRGDAPGAARGARPRAWSACLCSPGTRRGHGPSAWRTSRAAPSRPGLSG